MLFMRVFIYLYQIHHHYKSHHVLHARLLITQCNRICLYN